ncbi:hypothetical protein D3C75_1045900 [compost metagenome]
MQGALPEIGVLHQFLVIIQPDKDHLADSIPLVQPVIAGQYNRNIYNAHDQQQGRQHVERNHQLVGHHFLHRGTPSFPCVARNRRPLATQETSVSANHPIFSFLFLSLLYAWLRTAPA